MSLYSLLDGELYLDVQLKNKLESSTKLERKTVDIPRRTVGSLLKKSKEIEKNRMEKIRQENEKKKTQELEALSKNEKEIWKIIDQLVRLKTRKSYSDAIKRLLELKELAVYTKKVDSFSKRVTDLCDEFHRSYSFIEKIQATKIIEKVN